MMESINNSSTAIKNWAVDDRPREKLLAKGKEALSDSELLAILINTGSGKDSALTLAQKIMANCNNDLGLLSKLTVDELINHKGIGHAKAITIVAAMELSRRRQAGILNESSKINSSQEAAQFCQNILRDHQQEVFLIIFLKTNNKIIDYKIPFKGGMTMTTVDSKVIYQMALEKKATQIILCHNHPSGNLAPSKNDELLTQRLVQAGKLLDIKVIDHIIVSDEGYFSFADEGKI